MSEHTSAFRALAIKVTAWATMMVSGREEPATPVRSPSPDTPRKHKIPRTGAFSLLETDISKCCRRHPIDCDSDSDDEHSMDKTTMGERKYKDK
jgi:hypothetical protein